MSEETFAVIMTLTATTLFWLCFFNIDHFSDEMASYRQGYAECTAGMDSRYDPKVKP